MFIDQRTTRFFRVYGLVFSFVLLSACSEPNQETDQKIKPTTTQASKQSANYHQSADIRTISPSMSYDIKRVYIGKVVSKQLTSLSFEYAGKVAKVYVDSGDLVSKGQLLAEFDTELLTIQRQAIVTTIEQFRARAELNRLNLSRINNLSTKGYSSKQAVDELEAEKKIISADISRQQANIASIEYQISHAKLHAPFAAVISSRTVAEGENFSRNQKAFNLIQQADHEVSVGVPIKVASQLVVGQTLSITLNKQTLTGRILAIGKQVHEVSRTIELRLGLKQTLTFYNGQLAQVNIKQRVEQAGFWLPLSALTDGIRGQWNVYQVTNTRNDLLTISATTVEVKYATLDAAYITGLPLVPHEVIASGVHRYVPRQIVKRITKAIKQMASTGQSL
ncbi:efflux RND transporter periplasmic adaptor subunit [Colwellia sp. C1TZA3]|uniref:efflux RND transporter periplasmic adaptor subunit n=1 Tax=Colwellia sp. C1TZA3 TaxID=2508879 RepID=UPI0011B9B314|nr:efflux RND transporter periplasmic adaptor subunit [Colwellia sp. C1TZA3]TWX70196.1 efflux RND transporter periplasmic adaptor subunit [Colwellia sp. C1TZA3]